MDETKSPTTVLKEMKIQRPQASDITMLRGSCLLTVCMSALTSFQVDAFTLGLRGSSLAITSVQHRSFWVLGPSPRPIFPQLDDNDASSECDMVLDEATDDIVTEELNLSPDFDEQGLSSDDDLHWFRFGAVGRLYEDEENSEEDVLERLKTATVAVIGMGGTGSWAAEALVRSGVGNLVLVDLDDICISNTNRQLHTLSTNVGSMKTDVMRERLVAINPFTNITLIHDFVMLDNVEEIFGEKFKELNVDVVIDAIDGDEEKAALIAACADYGFPVVTKGTTAGKSDPTQIVCADLTQVRGDGLLSDCRNRLVKDFDFKLDVVDGRVSDVQKPWNILAVYSTQGVTKEEQTMDFGAATPMSSFRNDGALGTACFVTGTFGFVVASRVVEMIVDRDLEPPSRI